MRKMTVAQKEIGFLRTVYQELDFVTGTGYYRLTEDMPLPSELAHVSWVVQAQKLGAEAIFFVNDYPTVLFFKLDVVLGADTEEQEEQIRQLYLKVWNTSWVPLFFVALPGELRVYSAYQKPRQPEEWRSEERWLRKIQTLTQVTELVDEFSRAEIESGRLFKRRASDFNRENRVDQCLLKNLRLLRGKIEGDQGEKREYAHALIGRSIFIRYLEDRGILVEAYFADKSVSPNGDYHCYTDVLQSKADTYNNLFPKLTEDFNGDLFPLVDEEKQVITEPDLKTLRGFLLGKSMGEQQALFFWAYRFDIIPIELISNIYEEFYHEHNTKEDEGTHYTPTSLVDFVLTECLTTERLDAGARVLDPACGSGIFLVEAFKRMVYHACRRQNVQRLPSQELSKLLTERIVGIDINKAAVQVAAFSLYLAFLDFRDPPDIRKHKRLPNLVYDPAQPDSGKSLFAANAFQLTCVEHRELQERIKQNKRYAGRADDVRMLDHPLLPLEDAAFDVIVGNPPWGSAKGLEGQLAVQWCKAFRYPVGDRELSQAFIWRTRRLLKPEGEIGLLVSTGLLFKYQDQSKDFRRQWLTENRVRAVYNFAHVRHVFFRKQRRDAIAPFMAIFFTPAEQQATRQNNVTYVTIKQTALVEQLQAVIIDKSDLIKAQQRAFLVNDWLWKTCMWGNLNDVDLIGELKGCYNSLSDLVNASGRGFGDIRGTHTTDELTVVHELPADLFNNSAPLSQLIIPLSKRTIRRVGKIQLYKGDRLITKRGVSKAAPKFGEIQARLAHIPFAFTDKFIGFRIDDLNATEQKILLGIVLSSLAKYYHFLTCSMWGLWNYKIFTSEHLELPIHFPQDEHLKTRIIDAVEKLTRGDDSLPLFAPVTSDWHTLQTELDKAIFDLYNLSEEQRDLVHDLCQITLPFFYEGPRSSAAQPPSVAELEAYRDAFLEVWQERLKPKGKALEAKIYAPASGVLCGLAFELKALPDVTLYEPITDSAEWRLWFNRLSRSLRQEHSAGIYINRAVKELSDTSMLIIKRAERRLWTKSQARQDAQEFLTEVFRLEWQYTGGASL
jgi:hypothetical protein